MVDGSNCMVLMAFCSTTLIFSESVAMVITDFRPRGSLLSFAIKKKRLFSLEFCSLGFGIQLVLCRSAESSSIKSHGTKWTILWNSLSCCYRSGCCCSCRKNDGRWRELKFECPRGLLKQANHLCDPGYNCLDLKKKKKGGGYRDALCA